MSTALMKKAERKDCDMKKVRCSLLPRVMKCPASLQVPDVEIDTESENARLGSAVHAALAPMVREEPDVDFHAIAGTWNIEQEQMMPLYHIGRRIWSEYAPAIKVSRVEQRLAAEVIPGLQLTGHADVLGVTVAEPHTIIILDWKTGSSSADYRDALIGYADLATTDEDLADPDIAAGAKIITVWLRDQFVEIEDIGAAEIEDWRTRLESAIEHPDQYGPSPEACKFCPRQHECAARTALVQSAIKDLTKDGESDQALEPAALAERWPDAQLVKQILDNYYEQLKATLRLHGTLPLGDGREIGLDDRKKETIHLMSAMPVIRDTFGENIAAIAPALTVGKTKLTKLVSDRAEKGMKGKDIAAFLENLREAGAVSETKYKVLAVRKIQPVAAE